jgi:gluconate 2-dehydrogenase gamma chain
LLYVHACEGAYGAPEYGGNRDLAGWQAIGFPGDVQPRGYADEEVSGRD